MSSQVDPRRRFLQSLIIAGLAAIGLYFFGAIQGYNQSFSYLPWNLFLATIPLILAMRLVHVLSYKRWSDWEPLGWTLLWLIFLPNSFYMISDFIHLVDIAEAHALYVAVMFTSFIALGVILGFCSLILVHRELIKRQLSDLTAGIIISLVLAGSSFAIYLGRDLRWNSWDIFVSPAGLLFDLSERLLRPEDYPTMFITVFSFSALLLSLYYVLWSAYRLLRR